MSIDRSDAFPGKNIVWLRGLKLPGQYRQIVLFVAASGLNTLFGYGMYAAFVFIGSAPPMALLLATILGIGFNFVTFGKAVFNRMDSKMLGRFVCAYGCNYFGNVYALTLLHTDIPSPYIAQLAIAPFSLLFLYVVMKYFVFASRT